MLEGAIFRTIPYQRHIGDEDVFLRAPTPSAGFCVLAVLFVSRSMDLVSSVYAQESYFWERKHWEEPVTIFFFFEKPSFPTTLVLLWTK